MKKCLKFIFFAILTIIIILSIGIIYFFQTTRNVNLDKNKLINFDRQVIYLDRYGKEFSEQSNGREIVFLKEIPLHVQKAFICVEDKRFYKHKGIDYKGLMRATAKNITSLSFKEGASTISQQLIKNTHLSNEKKLRRKLLELKLSKQLEKNYSKDEILESYLNTIYFGNGCYGISNASKRYFSKKTNELTIEEGAILAGIINAPTKYSPFNDVKKCNERKKTVLNRMYEQNVIDEYDYKKCSDNYYEFENVLRNRVSFNELLANENNFFLDKHPYLSKKIYLNTTHDLSIQKTIDDIFDSYEVNAEKSIIVLNSNGEILAFNSSCGVQNRQVGSTLKPLAVYCPAIQEKIVDSCSFIKDEPIEINGYSPKNYNNLYSGEISVKSSLAKSSNVCAVELISMLGANNSINYLKR